MAWRSIVLPAACFTELIRAAALDLGWTGPIELTNLVFQRPLVLEGTTERQIQTVLSAATDFTGRVDLSGLPAGQRIFYEAQVEGASPVQGNFRTAPATAVDVRFLWSGDMVGQGWGINPDIGGIRIFFLPEYDCFH